MEVAWLGVYPALPIQFRKAWGGGECSHATSERFFNCYVLVTGGGREKGCSLATDTSTVISQTTRYMYVSILSRKSLKVHPDPDRDGRAGARSSATQTFQ